MPSREGYAGSGQSTLWLVTSFGPFYEPSPYLETTECMVLASPRPQGDGVFKCYDLLVFCDEVHGYREAWPLGTANVKEISMLAPVKGQTPPCTVKMQGHTRRGHS